MSNKYEQIHGEITDFLLSGQTHSTLIGKIITVGGKKDSDKVEAEEFATYIVNLLKKARGYRKGDVKNSLKRV